MGRSVCRGLHPVTVEDGILVVEDGVLLRGYKSNTLLRPLLLLDGWSDGPDLINRLVMSSPWCSFLFTFSHSHPFPSYFLLSLSSFPHSYPSLFFSGIQHPRRRWLMGQSGFTLTDIPVVVPLWVWGLYSSWLFCCRWAYSVMYLLEYSSPVSPAFTMWRSGG